MENNINFDKIRFIQLLQKEQFLNNESFLKRLKVIFRLRFVRQNLFVSLLKNSISF